jgi:two-component system, chemotaxis family, protein-glutamate methylesterase/glutaminase
MRKIRVLIVDDSVVMRRILINLLNSESGIEVVGFAPNGRVALTRLAETNPDIVTLDLEMPEMNGMDTLSQIRKTRPHLPVIIVSAISPQEVAAALDALSRGANEYVVKPGANGQKDAERLFRDELISKIKALCPDPEQKEQPSLLPVKKLSTPVERIDVLAIGVSTGGPNALHAVLSQIPANLPVPIVVVQHMPPLFTKFLAERLSSKCAMPVREAMPGKRLEPGHVWLAPGDYHMIVKRQGSLIQLDTNQAPPENACRPSVDVLFKSVAEVYGVHVLAVIMTGMGNDGLRGCEWIRAAGGQVLAQDEATSVVWGMPGAVAKAGLADRVLPLDQLSKEILRRIRIERASLSQL